MTPSPALAITGDDTALRLARLTRAPSNKPRFARAALTPGAATLAIVVPMLAIVLMLSVTALTSCTAA